ERLTAQLVEKDSNLQKWREERDELVEALEVQLKTLASSTIQKDKEIEELKQAALTASEKGKETDIVDLRKQLAEKDDYIKEMKQQINHENLQSLAEVPLPEEGQDKIDQSVNKEVCLFMYYLHVNNPVGFFQYLFLYIVLEISQNFFDFVKSENKRNAKPAVDDSPSTSNKKMMSTAQSLRKEYPLRRQESTLSKKLAKKKDGTLQKIGDFFQSSPTIFHSKAKKFIETLSSPKSAEPENVKENELKPKRAKRKLYSTDISCPLDIPGSSVLVEQKKKESDHLIIKRRLRSRIAK
ncbi:KI20B protein, partial [Mystacornis crossleyi]|nr:KI20B protein [Mystacornis crossleyi]